MSEQYTKSIYARIIGDSKEYKDVIHNFSVHLGELGYRESTRHSYHSALTHFVFWLVTEAAKDREFDGLVSDFLQQHLPVCHCPPPIYKEIKTVRAALNQFLSMLGQDRFQAFRHKGSPAVELELHQLDDFQRDVCGLTEETRANRQRFVRGFLVWMFNTGRIDVSSITSKVLIKYVTEKATNLKSSSVGVLLGALRGYLRFLQFRGDSTLALIATIPRPPNWSLATLPPSLSDVEMTRFLTSFDTSTTIGKRDYAMARCLVDLCLRCHEVASLQIGDINWHRGVIELHHNKSRRDEQLPLPDTTGHAIIDYLRYGRPPTSSRSIFVLHRAPIGCGVANTTVRGAIRRALSRAGLPWNGSHILRHTAASRMVQGGVTLKEVADVLRHRDISTTQIYTKVNLPELKRVAMPWPGRRS